MSSNGTKQQVNGLYPIIRRVRRPLLPVDPPAEKPVSIKPPGESVPTAPDLSETAEEKKTDARDSNQ